MPPKESAHWDAHGLGQEELNNWSIEVFNGRFKVQVLIGSPTVETYNCLQINGKDFPKMPVLLSKGQTQQVTSVIKVSTGRITLTSKCKEDDP